MNKLTRLNRYIDSLDGYKMSDTHFKIGSKIHSKDFYYAKRLFQNSYYTSRIATLLAFNIKSKMRDKTLSLTLVGYELYSELLLSLTKKILNDFGYAKVDHVIAIDAGDNKIEHLQQTDSISEEVIIIIPIASTGSTSQKIENYIKQLQASRQANISFSHFTVLLALDKHFSDEEIALKEQRNEPIITLNTEWRSPSNCEWCFNSDTSKPLFETDKSSLTPALIFGLPSSKKIESEDISLPFRDVDFTDALIYRKAVRNNEHFLFSTNTDILIDKNLILIKEWLDNLREKLDTNDTDKIVLISPCHYTNTKFINMVNEYVFNSSATIIHHQTEADYLANFKVLNKGYLNQADAKVFFVDDSLISGKNFFHIYDLYRFTAGYEQSGLRGAIFLSNKSSPDVHKRVSRASKNIFSFVNINLPIPPKIFDRKPLDHEARRYSDLADKSLHDTFKIIFRNKAIDLIGQGAQRHIGVAVPNEKIQRHLKMFRATHSVYEFFGDKQYIENLDFADVLRGCGFNRNEIEDRMAMMKVLSQYPFLLYMPLRKQTFKWFRDWMESFLNEFEVKVAGPIDRIQIEYNQFREFKFLIRRAIFLGNHIILEERFFKLIAKIFELIELPDRIVKFLPNDGPLFPQALEETETENVKDFHVFLMQRYLELIQKNSWAASKIKNVIENTMVLFKCSQARQFTRMLQIETAVVLNDFYTLLESQLEWRQLYKVDDYKKQVKIVDDTVLISDFLLRRSEEALNSNKFSLSNAVLKIRLANNTFKKQFINYLWIKQFLRTDKYSKAIGISIGKKTEILFGKLKGLFEQPEKLGGFFIVKDGRDEAHLVYDLSKNGNPAIKELSEVNHDLIIKFLNGESDEFNIGKKSIIEYENATNETWTDIYSLDRNHNVGKKFLRNYRWLLMLRISSTSNNTLGLVGFYSEDSMADDLLAKQLLVLLRGDIGHFVSRHHKNDEFATLRQAETVERFAYLAGHGRLMIQRLAQSGEELFVSVAATMEKLQYLFATKLVPSTGYTSSSKTELNKLLLRNVFAHSPSDKFTVADIVKLGNLIYASEDIENKVELNYPLNNPESSEFNFNFNSDILKFICFELFVNAKKNRYHFINGECPACFTAKNDLALTFELKGDGLTINLKGTGPEIPSELLAQLKTGIAFKPNNEISGIELINRVILLMNKDNRISISSDKIKPCCNIFENVVSIHLKSKAL